MRKRIVFAAVSVLALVFASVAYAQTETPTNNSGNANNTKTSIAVSGLSSTKGGTSKKPKQQSKLRLVINSEGINGAKQAGTSSGIKSTLAKGWSFNTKRWPDSKKCSTQTVNVAKRLGACASNGSKVAGGVTNVLALQGGVDCGLRLSAFVLKTEKAKAGAPAVPKGAMGTFVEGGPGVRVNVDGKAKDPCPTQLSRMLVGTVKGGVWNVKIDEAVQAPAGIFTGIKLLDFRFNGKVKVKGKTYGIAQSTGCSGGKWTYKVQNSYRTGGKGKTATDDVKCKK